MKYLICLAALLWAGMKLTAADTVTENSRQLSSLFTFIARRIKPEGVNLPAFERRLINTCFNRCASVFNINEDTGV